MRDILSKVMTGSMIAGAALLVAACSGGGNEANNMAGDNMGDVYNTDLGTENMGADMNAGMGGNMGADMNAGMGGNMGTDMNAGMGNASGNMMTNTQ